MKTKYDFKNSVDAFTFKSNIIYLLRKSFFSLNIYNDETIKESIHCSPFIDEYTEEEKKKTPYYRQHPYYFNYNLIDVFIPLKTSNVAELRVFIKKMKSKKFIFKIEPEFRVNYRRNNEYSKICNWSVNMQIDFSRGAKQIKETINDNQLKLF